MGILTKTTIMKLLFLGLCLFAVFYENEATVAISVPAVGLALTATQVTNLALIKLIGVQTGLILGRLSRNKRQVFDDDDLNTVSQSQTVGDLATLLAKHELQQCTQLLFCAAAPDNSEIVLDKDIDELRRVVTQLPGRYRSAHKLGQQNADNAPSTSSVLSKFHRSWDSSILCKETRII